MNATTSFWKLNASHYLINLTLFQYFAQENQLGCVVPSFAAIQIHRHYIEFHSSFLKDKFIWAVLFHAFIIVIGYFNSV